MLFLKGEIFSIFSAYNKLSGSPDINLYLLYVTTRKKICRSLFFLLVCTISCVNSGTAQSVTEYIKADSLRVGDNFEFIITLNVDEEYDDILFPDSTDFGDVFEIRERQQFKASAYKDSVLYQLQFFGTTDTLLPPLPVRMVQGQDTTTVYTNPVPISFLSLLASEDEQLRPFKPIFDFAAAWWPYIVGFLLLLAAAVYYYYWIRRKPEPETEPRPTFQPAPFRDPLKELQQTLAALEEIHPETEKQFEKFYIGLGDAIREYFETLYKIPALESTSREIILQLDKRAIDNDLVTDTRAVLQEADMVKFAKFTPTTEQAEKALEKGYNFLKRARQVDGSKVEHLRQRHRAKVEKEREQFNDKYKIDEEEN